MAKPSASWPPPEELAVLIQTAQQGRPRDMDILLGRIRSPLLRAFESRLPHDDAEDLTQVALVRVARAVHRIDPTRGHRYLWAVARNLLRSAFRAGALEASRFTPLPEAEDVDSGEDIEALVEYHEILDRIHESSRVSLPDPLRHVVLALIRGDSLSDIADQQRLNPITVRTRLLRARALLRLYLESDYDTW
ncbi:MAG: sigma-70 family RNA polymerase sigma factor [Gemmatimonadota bacterium]|nr:sigma-70 family RNA polymerase sigma factor [Gemmatimonadota bacterium]